MKDVRPRISMLGAIMAFSQMTEAMRVAIGGFSGFCSDKNVRASKGQAKYSGKKPGNRPSGKYDGVTNGKRERARRMRQIERGILKLA